jgi:hypothetical protein
VLFLSIATLNDIGCKQVAGGGVAVVRNHRCFLSVYVVLLSVLCFSGCGVGNGTWKDTAGRVPRTWIHALVYDPAHNLLYAGADEGVWKYDGTTWTDTAGEVSGREIISLAYDPAHNLVYAGTIVKGVWKYTGTVSAH